MKGPAVFIALITLAGWACVIVGSFLWRRRRKAIEVQAVIDQAVAASEKMAAHAEATYEPLGRTTDEILSHEDDDKKGDVLAALCYRIAGKAAIGGEDSLTDTERRLCAAYDLEGQVNNGGFDQYFFNSTGGDAEIAREGLQEMGASIAAALLDRAMAVFPDGKPPRERSKRWKVMDRMASRSKPVWDQCDAEFYARKEDVYELCLAYAKKKRKEIVLPGGR